MRKLKDTTKNNLKELLLHVVIFIGLIVSIKYAAELNVPKLETLEDGHKYVVTNNHSTHSYSCNHPSHNKN
jgi:hypothetical protein